MPLTEFTRVQVNKQFRSGAAQSELVAELAKAISKPQVRALRRIVEGEEDREKAVTYFFSGRKSRLIADGISATMARVLMEHLLTIEKGNGFGVYTVRLSSFGKAVLEAATALNK